jgi:molybdopterin/thiamine biosynthesis adenylyltransferase
MTTLAIAGDDAERLLAALTHTDETAWVMSARVANEGNLLLGRRLLDVPEDAYRERGPRRLQIESPGFAPAIGRALRDGCLPVFIHTHPSGNPAPSELDDEVDLQLAKHAIGRGAPGYASLVLGGTPDQPRFTGRLQHVGTGTTAISRLRIAGTHIGLVLADQSLIGTPAHVFDRQVRAFGAPGQRLLSALHVGVVGAGGTGSAAVEMLARLGVGEITILDDDIVEETNLTRIHGATVSDVGTSKAELAARLATAYGTDVRAHSLAASAASPEGVRALKGCDVVMGCTDDHAGRLVLSRLAYRYLIPTIDCGVIVDVDDHDRVRGVVGRVTVMVPNEPCLLCRGQADARRAAEEMMDPEQRLALAGEGYAEGVGGPAPAVVAFTTATAALAVSELLGRLFNYAESTSSQMLLRMHAQTISRGGRSSSDGHDCTNRDTWGLGDTEPPLGIVGLQ